MIVFVTLRFLKSCPDINGIERIGPNKKLLNRMTLMQVLGATSECLIDEAENFQTRKYVALDSYRLFFLRLIAQLFTQIFRIVLSVHKLYKLGKF